MLNAYPESMKEQMSKRENIIPESWVPLVPFYDENIVDWEINWSDQIHRDRKQQRQLRVQKLEDSATHAFFAFSSSSQSSPFKASKIKFLSAEET